MFVLRAFLCYRHNILAYKFASKYGVIRDRIDRTIAYEQTVDFYANSYLGKYRFDSTVSVRNCLIRCMCIVQLFGICVLKS